MGKRSTAARGARRASGARKTAPSKIRNKKSQRTPKLVRKQLKRAEKSKQEQWDEIYDSSKKRLSNLSFSNLTNKIAQKLNPTMKANKKNCNVKNKKMRIKSKLSKKEENKDDTFDFSTYDREKDDESSCDEKNENDKSGQCGQSGQSDRNDRNDEMYDKTAQKYEMRRIGLSEAQTQERSYDDILDDYDKANENVNDNDWDMDVSKINDYMNLNENKNENENENENSGNNDTESDDNTIENIDNSMKNNILNENSISYQEWHLSKKERNNELKTEIADICSKILSDPYVHSRLFELLYSLLQDKDVEIVQCCMLSLTRCIIDVMPPYRIGTMKNDTKLKKENENVRKFENELLSIYHKFLKFLFKSSQIFHSNVNHSRMKREARRFIIGKCAIKCNCMFLKHASHFNYTKEVIKRTIPLLNSPNSAIRYEACEAMKCVLGTEPINNVTVEAVKSICNKIESRNFDCNDECIDVFLSLPLKLLHAPDIKMDDENVKPTLSKQEKKLKQLANKDLKELDGIDKEKEFQRQKIIIESIFSIYFYILKLNENSKLLACALRGMSKFAQLVNVELVVSLISVLSEKLENDKTMNIEAKLHCILTAFGCMTGRGTAIEMDLKNHYCTLYSILNEMIYYYNWIHFDLVFECLDRMFNNKKNQIVIDRIGAFIKRIMTLSLHVPGHFSIGLIHQARKLMKCDARLESMLIQGGGYDQIYDASNDNPDQSHALASCLWESTANCRNYHLFCQKYCRDFTSLKEIPIKLELTRAKYLCNDHNHSKKGNFNPIIKFKGNNHRQTNNVGHCLDNQEKIDEMIDSWFEFDDKHKGLEKTKYWIKEEDTDECLDYFFKCHKLNQRTQTLADLNDKFLVLNELLMQD